MSLTEALPAYFRGEKHLGLALALLGVALVAAAVWSWRTQAGSFGLWLAGSLGLMGMAFGVGGAALAVRSQGQTTRLMAQMQTDPGEVVAQETVRMARVNANWPRAKVAWAVVLAVGSSLILLAGREWATALGLSLLLLATTLYFADVFAERRAMIYTAALGRAGAP